MQPSLVSVPIRFCTEVATTVPTWVSRTPDPKVNLILVTLQLGYRLVADLTPVSGSAVLVQVSEETPAQFAPLPFGMGT